VRVCTLGTEHLMVCLQLPSFAATEKLILLGTPLECVTSNIKWLCPWAF
jgi:hypothetical protein